MIAETARNSAETALKSAAATRLLLKDGPYGTAVQALRLAAEDYRGGLDLARDQKGNNDLCNLTQPAAMRRIADTYAEAGADILATNTFNANEISQSDYDAQHLVEDINRAAASITRAAARAAEARDGVRRFVAGALGPTNKTLSLSPRVEDPGYREVDFNGMVRVYRQQIDALLAGQDDDGVDFILIETVFDTLNAKAAAFAAADAADTLGRPIPVMLSMTLTDLAGRNLSGQTVEAFWTSVRHTRPATIGLNCSFGATELRPHVQALSGVADALVMVYPNAGLPNDLGEYDEPPSETGRLVGEWARAGLINIVGGCCGTTPEHIAAMRDAVAGLPPRRLPAARPALHLSGLEAFSFAA